MRNIRTFLKKLGYKSPYFYGDWYEDGMTELWGAWYKGHDADFHDYKINRGEGAAPIACQRATLNMAKKGCEYWADLLWNGDCSISIDGATTGADTMFQYEMEANDFTRQTIQLVEHGMAYGTAAYSVYYEIDQQGYRRPKLDYFTHEYIVPLRWDNNHEIEAVAFPSWEVDTDTEKVSYYIRIVEQDGGAWTVYNIYGESATPEGEIRQVTAPVDEYGNTRILDRYTVKNKPFEVFRPNIVNNQCPASPMGISVFANCIDTLKSIDLAYDGAKMAMLLGRPRVAISNDLLYFDKLRRQPTFDPVDFGVYALNGIDGEEANIIEDLTAEYIADKFEASLREQLDIYGQQIGLGEKAFKYGGVAMKTATEVVVNNNAMLRTMEKHQEALRTAIMAASRAVCEVLDMPDVDIDITFDDSVTRDREAERQRWIGFVDRGWITPATYLERFEGLSEEEAQAIIISPADILPLQNE